MRLRTAAILSIVFIGGMFVFPRVMLNLFPSLGQFGFKPYPERLLLTLIDFSSRFKWVLALPIAATLFTVAAFTSSEKLTTIEKVGTFIVGLVFLPLGLGGVASSVFGFFVLDTTSFGAFIPFALLFLLTGLACSVSGFKLMKRAVRH